MPLSAAKSPLYFGDWGFFNKDIYLHHEPKRNHSTRREKMSRYWPVVVLYALVIAFSYLTVLLTNGHFMSHFMGWTMIAFGMLKLEDIDTFAEGFRKYDFFAASSSLYAKSYPMLEVVLGVFFLINLFIFPVTVAVLIMYTSTLFGLSKKLHLGEKIDCLCLGVRFRLPLSIVAVFESSVMVAMAVWMLSM